MKIRRILPTSLVSLSLVAGSGRAAPAEAARRPEPARPITEEMEPAARLLAYSARDVATVKTHVRYTTLIVLPKNEQVLDIACGDKEYWVVNGSFNLAYVK